jgi:hypothetical protein
MVKKTGTHGLVSDKKAKHSQGASNTLLLVEDDKNFGQTQFLNSVAGDEDQILAIEKSPNVGNELLLIQESFKDMRVKRDDENSQNVSFTKTLPLKVVQLNNDNKDQGNSLDPSSIDYTDS